MLRRLSILAALIVSVLLLGGTTAASQAPTLAPRIYLPHTPIDSTCGAPPQIPLALGTRRLAFISGNANDPHAITLFDPVTNHAEPLIADDSAISLAWSPDAT